MFKNFQLNGRRYEYIATALDQSQQRLGDVVIYREEDGQHYLSMPLSELQARLQAQRPVDWTARLRLYRQRFVGRSDLYAERYFNKKMQRKAYSPAGPWEDGHKSETKHYPLTDDILRRHFSTQDSYAIGLYPMTPENQTPFLAIDIDGHHAAQPWQELTESLREVCTTYQIPYLVELSQSGQGVHFWVFFATPLSASKARQLGDALLQATQAVNPQLPFTAFDRMFPAQDFVGGKQFGNLIAAPLEGQAQQQSKGVFVDEHWQPLKDQWQALAQVGLITDGQVAEMIQKIRAKVDFQLFDPSEPSEPDLFTMKKKIEQPLTIIRANGLYVRKSMLSSQQILQLKWLASFHNPKFYEAQNNRMSVYNIPRIITLFQESPNYLVLPRGLADEVSLLATKIEWVDKTMLGTSLDVHFNGVLRPNQQEAFRALTHAQNGILAARTGFGKTVIAAALIAQRKCSTLILVKNKTLAEQWQDRLATFLTIDSQPVVAELTPTGRKRRKAKVGSYYGTKKNLSGLVDIATSQAVGQLPIAELRAFLDRYGMVISDEVHHDSARTFDAVIQQVRSRCLYGLSATPYRRDGQEPIIIMRFGPIRFQTEAIDPVFANSIRRLVIPRFTNLGMTSLEMLNHGRTENNQAILADAQRDGMILRDCQMTLEQGRHAIVLTNLVAHVDQLYAQLPAESTFRIYGGFSAKQRNAELARLAKHTGSYLILATVSTAGEGLDVPTLDTLVLAMPISFHGNVEQVVGRLHRDLENKSELRIYDYVDMFVPMLMRMYRKRCKAYRYLDYQVQEDQYSRQRGLQVYDGKYQIALADSVRSSQTLLVVVPKLTSYLRRLANDVIAGGGVVQICTQTPRDQLVAVQAEWTQYDHNLPNCVIVDERQLWLSADGGFSFNKGMTMRLDHQELIRQFKRMLLETTSGFTGI
ncbi:TOTE conflict system archaeo-eukaryotic primase domain-containing protein [Lapidilactobacillus salsurivasis]